MVYRVTTTFTGPGVTGGGVNRLYFVEGAATSSALPGVVAAFWDAMDDLIRVDTIITTLGTVERIDDASGDLIGTLSYSDIVQSGANDQNAMPPATQGLLRLRTGFYRRGRELRGRIFIPALGQNFNSAGAPSAGMVTFMNTAGAALIDADQGWCVYGRPIDNPLPAAIGVTAQITSAQAWTKFAQLRSRRD